MGFWDTVLGRTKPVRPNLDRLFDVPSAALTLQAATGFAPTGRGTVCFAAVEGTAFTRVREEVGALLNAGTAGTVGSEPVGAPVEFSKDSYGYHWLLVRRAPDDLASLVNDVHAVNTSLEESGFGPHLLCSLVWFGDAGTRSLALVYLYKRGTFYPFAPLPGDKRDSPLELQTKALLEHELPVEPDLTRWFPIWGAPGG
ncbi:PspA-associated protein PspAB [Yinghuangia seranimata]|uniref:PspA-associated protein PspAB n=1 Tax=Yinghuangia seranimata TaxID=408067 RepID=UPI00248BC566|nr:hypothetical protein [Yinghuangia seranimata]MDI2124782.1 hypothetical protein [Yinghuangia seranimata]